MKNYLSDEFLYQFMPKAESAELDAIPPEEILNHSFSRRFTRKMQRLLKYERQSAFGRFVAKAGRIAVIFLVLLLLTHTVLMVSVEAYSETFYKITKTVTDAFTSFLVEVDDDIPTSELVPVEPPYIPEGFEKIEEYCSAISYTVIYLNEAGEDIFYDQSLIVSGGSLVDTEDAQVEIIQIQDCTAFVVYKDGMTQIRWIDEPYKYVVIGSTDYDTVLEVAKKIIG